MKKVEQILNNGEVVMDYDAKLKVQDIKSILSKYIEITSNKNPFECKYKNKDFNICIKQITYLGNPHPDFKKRIQISKDWKVYLKSEDTLLMGIYSYMNSNIFVIFDKSKYKNNNLNNSSAHVHTIDIQKALEYGVFEKTDSRGNIITILREDKLIDVINNFISKNENKKPEEIKLFDIFSDSLEKKWFAVDCYDEMFNIDYSKKKWAEWQAAYLEFKFETFIDKNKKYQSICTFVSNKKKGELDFDLNFNNKYLGDLKMHSESSPSIMGNKKESFVEAMKKYNKFWFVVFFHDTEKDKYHNYKATKHWEDLLVKDDPSRYREKMKYSIELKNMKILEVNKYNYKYVNDLTQGKNSDGNSRTLKVQINKKYIDNFLIYNREI